MAQGAEDDPRWRDARPRPSHPEDQSGAPQNLGGPGPCGMAPGYGGSAPVAGGYPDGRPQHAPDIGRANYSNPGESANRAPNSSGGGMDPSGGWYHGGHRAHYPPENYSSFHPVALSMQQNSGISSPQGAVPPPQPSMPPQAALPPQPPPPIDRKSVV